jgi:hypothetical protein
MQAEALCDLVSDPACGIARVSLVSASTETLDAVERAAAWRGLPTVDARRKASGTGQITLERPAAEGEREAW